MCVSTFIATTDGKMKLTAEVWKDTTETKSSEVLLAKGRKAEELRRPENSVNPFPFAWIFKAKKETFNNMSITQKLITHSMHKTKLNLSVTWRIGVEWQWITWRDGLATERVAEAILVMEASED